MDSEKPDVLFDDMPIPTRDPRSPRPYSARMKISIYAPEQTIRPKTPFPISPHDQTASTSNFLTKLKDPLYFRPIHYQLPDDMDTLLLPPSAFKASTLEVELDRSPISSPPNKPLSPHKKERTASFFAGDTK